MGFVEYYPWNSGPHACSSLPYTSVIFGVPTTTTSGAIGSLEDAYEYGDCVGKVSFETHRTSDQGVAVSVGFNKGHDVSPVSIGFLTRVIMYLCNSFHT